MSYEGIVKNGKVGIQYVLHSDTISKAWLVMICLTVIKTSLEL